MWVRDGRMSLHWRAIGEPADTADSSRMNAYWGGAVGRLCRIPLELGLTVRSISAHVAEIAFESVFFFARSLPTRIERAVNRRGPPRPELEFRSRSIVAGKAEI